MSETMELNTRKVKSDAAVLAGRSRPTGRCAEAVMAAAHMVWPRKTAAELAALARTDVRNAERWLAGTRTLSTEALARLLRSEHGMEFLGALMEDARPPWWIAVRKAFALGTMRRQKSQLQEAINELAQCEDTLSRAETSLRIRDENFHREDIAALRATRGGLRGAVAR